MRHGSLFSGLGGFDLAAASQGWDNCFQVEKDPFCLTVLRKHFPTVPKHTDILTFNPEPYVNAIDVISGGFPCQPFSVAGQRKGTADDRYLWPAMLRVICAISPRWVVAENVHGLLSLDRGMVFEQVLSDLEAAGYEVQSVVLPAAGVGAPHIRNRVFIIAHTAAPGHRSGAGTAATGKGATRQKRKGLFRTPFEDGYAGHAAYANRHRLQRDRESAGPYQERRKVKGRHTPKFARADWRTWPTQPPVCGRDDGLSHQLDGISFSAWRQKSIQALGGAVVPELPFQIFRSIDNWEKSTASKIPSPR
ncbi:DNA cytosine methyltransferase [Chitinophaga parva]|uniref:Cytosine-specific methyltransferase n=1 Tax=Chitinophaga parva TaxID=2169414 RepID=A0A2T7BLR1_9BACT|nr:DNA (cytosine-5-)-methyltransferase [Chitinophaga parva]PUZ28618.1 DNA cytosine methyltransferase [Chitinophaga parva]